MERSTIRLLNHNKDVFTNYRMRRVMTKLSGNMKLDLVLDSDTIGNGEAVYVRQAHLRPIIGITQNARSDISEHLMDRPHQNNIKEFFEKNRGIFYDSSADPLLRSDWYMTVSQKEIESNLKYIKNWDDSLLSGCQRMSYGLYDQTCTHEILIPVWLDRVPDSGFRFNIQFVVVDDKTDQEVAVIRRILTISEQEILYHKNRVFHNDFLRYFIDYLRYINTMPKGNSSVININLDNGITTISGLKVESGNLETVQNYNIVRNLVYRERPLLEANSLIINSFADYKMICTQHINFNICFDLKSMIGQTILGIIGDQSGSILVKADVEILQRPAPGLPEVWTPLEVRDFYTNHTYIPRTFIKYDYGAGEGNQYYKDGPDYIKNVLEYKKDYKCTDIMHSNKIVQSICHWVYSRNPDGDLFNLYDGFGAYAKDKDGNDIEYNHGNGTTTDPGIDIYDPGADNTVWAGAPRIGDGGIIENTLNGPGKWVKNKYFKDMSNFIGGFEFNYEPSSPTDPSKIYIGTMTTPWQMGAEERKTLATTYTTPKHIIGILIERLDKEGSNSLPKFREDQTAGSFDEFYDWHYHSDTDNRFAIKKLKDGKVYYLYYNKELIENAPDDIEYQEAVDAGIIQWSTKTDLKDKLWDRVGGTGYYNTSMRQDMNMSALYIAMRRTPVDPGSSKVAPDSPLFAIAFHPRTLLPTDTNSDGMSYGTLYPHGLTLGGFIKAIQDYLKKYRPALKAIEITKTDPDSGFIEWPENIPDIEDLGSLGEAANSVTIPDVVWFDKSIVENTDYILSRNAKEIVYNKIQPYNNYVLRYSGNIKPAMFPEKVKRIDPRDPDSELMYEPLYGRNFFYIKDMIFPLAKELTEFQRLYISTGVPPKYPSLQYDSILPLVRGKQSPHGDILYNEPNPRFLGYDAASGEPIENFEPYKSFADMYNTYNWFEYKWFDKSRALIVPPVLKYSIWIDRDNNKETLERIALLVATDPDQRKNYIVENESDPVLPEIFLGSKGQKYRLDYPYIKSLYNIQYNLIESKPIIGSDGNYEYNKITGKVEYRYYYLITMTLN